MWREGDSHGWSANWGLVLSYPICLWVLPLCLWHRLAWSDCRVHKGRKGAYLECGSRIRSLLGRLDCIGGYWWILVDIGGYWFGPNHYNIYDVAQDNSGEQQGALVYNARSQAWMLLEIQRGWDPRRANRNCSPEDVQGCPYLDPVPFAGFSVAHGNHGNHKFRHVQTCWQGMDDARGIMVATIKSAGKETQITRKALSSDIYIHTQVACSCYFKVGSHGRWIIYTKSHRIDMCVYVIYIHILSRYT